MSKLIEQLKSEHAVLVEVLGEIRKLGIGSKEGQSKLLAAKASFLAHLKKEDVELYPPLRKAAEGDPRVKQTLEMFAKDMDAVSKDTTSFFEKYARGGSDLEFASDFGRLLATLGARIRKEESILYPEYDKLPAAAAGIR